MLRKLCRTEALSLLHVFVCSCRENMLKVYAEIYSKTVHFCTLNICQKWLIGSITGNSCTYFDFFASPKSENHCREEDKIWCKFIQDRICLCFNL
jgi:hypothetical protein